MEYKITDSKVLVTGGAGFIGSNLIDDLLLNGNQVVCLDNFSTGKRENLEEALENPDFKLIVGDIRDKQVCMDAVKGCAYVLHQAALGSVPRSIADPITSTEVNITGFVNMLYAAKEEKVKRFVYAASSSTYGDHPDLPKVEHKIGNSLSPYSITKFVNELYAANFSKIYGIETIGLRYFNVFGRRQDPDGAYAAVIPKFVSSLIRHESSKINGDGTYSRDFTYIENVLQANHLAAAVPTERIRTGLVHYQQEVKDAPLSSSEETLSEVVNVAYGERASLNELVVSLKENLSQYDPQIREIQFDYGPAREGDVPHSLASIQKAKSILGYDPKYSLQRGLKEACNWYWENA
ncbi:SDR family oxidoreductase [Cyclobacterium jeungdonense]|uniref:SDR family oxidoreductase n=1 Tax=Cyclobacterium jeungdonense TaxID=708087 RepID=A0ABT8C9K4_9BACT|nr:SDR family oxidoreductase [Cyclobacterium jeungdonense]MDN3689485.1 SDR family oxidoreductase [Cyclobacterium jeungdonense]